MPRYQVIIVGAGIVGLSTAFALIQARPELRVLVLEKEPRVALHQTGRNSGVIHTGVYYKPGSLKARLCKEGRAALLEFCQREAIQYQVCGKVIVATSEDELLALRAIEDKGKQNAVVTRRMSGGELLELEPEVSGIAALHVPGAGVVDFVKVAERLREILQENGVEIVFSTEVLEVIQRGTSLVVQTNSGNFEGAYLINAAGLQSDRVCALAGGMSAKNIQVIPFRGEYFELRESARDLVRHLVYPVPRPEFPFLGVHFTRGIDGLVECGPNAVLNLGRETYGRFEINGKDLIETLAFPGFLRLAQKYHRAGLAEMSRSLSKRKFTQAAQRLVPNICEEDLLPAPCGIRAQAVSREGHLVDDFVIEESAWALHVINAPSPAATSAFAIGKMLAERALRHEGRI